MLIIESLGMQPDVFMHVLLYRVFHKEWTNFEASFRSTQATPHAITKSVV
jgi:hypothetical protein